MLFKTSGLKRATPQTLKTRRTPQALKLKILQNLEPHFKPPQALKTSRSQDPAASRFQSLKTRDPGPPEPQAAAQFFVPETFIRRFAVTRIYIIRGGCFAALVFMLLNFEQCTQPPEYALIPYGQETCRITFRVVDSRSPFDRQTDLWRE
ncbi:hypothetical protein B0H14DRAFT_2679991 [Mycena olivaceomarginata]|nr:hypothetical protein B0H14DRAFT_2679991 [Mycena olivaceomarginata]